MNECAVDNGGCDAICVDTPLSFECQCHLGYYLAEDKFSCEGKYYKVMHNAAS